MTNLLPVFVRLVNNKTSLLLGSGGLVEANKQVEAALLLFCCVTKLTLINTERVVHMLAIIVTFHFIRRSRKLG